MTENQDSPEEIYANRHSSPLPGYLNQLERETHLKIAKPQMLTGQVQGRLIAMFSKLIQPEKVLEIGTFTGYGTLCLAEGLQKDGEIHTLENSEENVWLARKYFAISPFNNQIHIHMGLALEILPQFTCQWDLVYIDADKINNQPYFDMVWPNIKPGGLILIDNTFARNGVWKSPEAQKPFEKAVSELNAYLAGLAEALVVMLPLRDGLTAIRKA